MHGKFFVDRVIKACNDAQSTVSARWSNVTVKWVSKTYVEARWFRKDLVHRFETIEQVKKWLRDQDRLWTLEDIIIEYRQIQNWEHRVVKLREFCESVDDTFVYLTDEDIACLDGELSQN